MVAPVVDHGFDVRFEDLTPVQARLKAEQDFYWFCVEIMGFPDLYPPLHRDQLCRFLQEFIDPDQPKPVGNLEVARGHFKSTIASISWPLWLLMKDSNLRIYLCSAKVDSAVKMLKELKGHLLLNERLKSIAPDVFFADPKKESDLWHTDAVNVRRTRHNKVPSITAGGVDASVVSQHYHLHIHDDLVIKETARSDEMREKVREFRRESRSLFERTYGNCKTLNIGTRWHFDDAHQELEDGVDGEGPYAGAVMQLKLGCRDDDGQPLFPTVWSNEALEAERRLQGSFVFSAQFENNPMPSGEAYFKRSDIRWFDELPGFKRPHELEPGEESPKRYLFFTAVDPNRSEHNMGDPAVVMTAARDEDGHIYVVQMTRSHPTGLELVKIIGQHVQQWSPEKVIYEANNYQYQLKNWLMESQIKQQMQFNLQPVTRHWKSGKVDRIGSLQPVLETGRLHLMPGVHEVIAHELEQWPSSKHDDTLDCLADIYQHGHNPEPKKPWREAPTNAPTMELILGDIRDMRRPARATFGRRSRGFENTWMYR